MEKIYHVMQQAGIVNIVFGILLAVTGILTTVGSAFLIVQGSRLMKHKSDLMFQGGDSFMAKVNGAQSVEMIPGRKIVLSRGKGKTNVAELQWLTNTVLQSAAAWKQTG